MTEWGDVNARVRGLATHLLHQDELDALAGLTDLHSLAERLTTCPAYRLVAGAARSVAGIEWALHEVWLERVAVFVRWLGGRERVLRPLFLLQDRDSLRHLIRGLRQGVGIEVRMRGCTPTPTLDRAAWRQLADCRAAPDVAPVLANLGHVFAAAVVLDEELTGGRELFGVEHAVTRALAGELRKCAKGADPPLRFWVAHQIDVENVLTALAVTGDPAAAESDRFFLEGGEQLEMAAFQRACASVDSHAALNQIAHLSWMPTQRVYDVSTAANKLLLSALWRKHQLDPLNSALALWWWARTTAEVQTLRHYVWATSLGMTHVPFGPVSI